MRNFNYDDNDEFQNEIDKFFHDEGDEDYEEEYHGGQEYTDEEIVRAMEMEAVYNQQDMTLLQLTIQMLEKSFWWKFYSYKSQVKRIASTYAILHNLLMEIRKERSSDDGDV